MTGRPKRNRRGPSPDLNELNVPEDIPTSLAGDSVALAVFKQATKHLNDRQDRHERLFKISRDITIESKRIIFLLHSPIKKEGNQKALADAKERIDNLIEGPLKNIGLELENSAPYLHHKAITAGFQEYIEARTLYSILSSGKILPYAEAQKELEYVVTEKDEPRIVVTELPHIDYMLGIADLTGELMRKAINTIPSGDKEDVFQDCQIIRDLYIGYIGLSSCRLLSRKLPTTRANLNKVEMAVYGLHLRDKYGKPSAGMEFVNHPMPEDANADEGYY